MNSKENKQNLSETDNSVISTELVMADKGICRCDKNCGCCENKEKKKEAAGRDKTRVAVASTLALMLGAPAMAQDASATPSFWTDPFNHPMLSLYLTIGLVVVTVLLMLATLIYLVRVIKFLTRENEMARAEKAGIKYVPQPSLTQKIWQDLNDAVPLAQEKDIDLGHNYDGIRELDNHLPPWWKGLFYGCIVWGIGYLIVYHITDNFPLSLDEYQNELTLADEQAKALRASRPAEVIDENNLAYTADPELISKGKTVFVSNNCGSCHRADGGGSTIGPNLTDEYWLHGGNVRNIYTTINTGVVEKGMPAWGKVMSAVDVRNVTFYIMSLQGSNPKDGKAPQGELYKPEPVTAPADSIVAVAN